MASIVSIKKVNNASGKLVAELLRAGDGDKAVDMIKLYDVRFSFAFIGTPSEDKGDDGRISKKWRSQFLLPKDTHREAVVLCKEVITKVLADAKAEVPKSKWFYQDGDSEELEAKVREITAGHFVVSASDGKFRPPARDVHGRVLDNIAKIDEMFYGGMYGNAIIRPWYFNGKSKSRPDKNFPKRVPAGLDSVQFLRAGQRLGSGTIDTSDAWGAAPGAEAADSGNGFDDSGL